MRDTRLPNNGSCEGGANSQVTVVLADQDPISRHVLGAALRKSRFVRLIASVDAGRPVNEWPIQQSDVVVLATGTLGGQQQVVDELIGTGTRLLILDTHWTRRRLTSAIASGVAGCLVKKVDVGQLIPAVVAAAAGTLVLSQELAPLHTASGAPAAPVTVNARDDPPAQNLLGTLTRRERDVLSLLAGGMTTEEVAASLIVSPATVKSHVSHALPKLGVRNRVEALLLVQHLLAREG